MVQLIIILVLGFLLRIFGINWDQGMHFHPDERQLILIADQINFFKNLDPNFFNYGSLPIYLLKGTSQILSALFGPYFVSYDGMLYVGRTLSALAEVGTIYLIYKISHLLFKNERTSLFSSLFYAIAFFPIQNGHFFIVDTFLTLFVGSTIFFALNYLGKPILKNVFFISSFFAAAITTKFTALTFSPIIVIAIIYKNWGKFKTTLAHLLLYWFLLLNFCYIFMPYAFIKFQKFLADISLRLKLNNDPYIFPYTLQYVGTLPYVYYLKNIFWYGIGPFISVLSLAGIFYLIKNRKWTPLLVFYLIFNVFFFFVVGKSAAKFMRYLLPTYPLLTILAGYAFTRLKKYLAVTLLILSVVWSLMFLNIYTKTHTRIAATNWALRNIPSGATIAVEHWDDRVPFLGNFKFEELTLYDQPDSEIKWKILGEKLDRSDYIVIASNRLYVPIQRLNDCSKYKSCFPISSVYYQKLFNNELPFKKVAEFTSYPNLFGFELRDDTADESFTVYDHPKILIFKRSVL